jgi:hypothetical protein
VEKLTLVMDMEFTATNGCPSRWRNRNYIGYVKMFGEERDADNTAASHLLKDFKIGNLYNADKTMIYYRVHVLPDGSLRFKKSLTAGSKKPKDRIRVLVTVNMSGMDK